MNTQVQANVLSEVYNYALSVCDTDNDSHYKLH